MFPSSILHCFHCIDARLHNWTTFGETLDWSHIIACSALITPTTNFNVTFFLVSPEGVNGYTLITNLTSLNIAEETNVSFPYEGITVSLQILEEEPGKSGLVCVCEPVVTVSLWAVGQDT